MELLHFLDASPHAVVAETVLKGAEQEVCYYKYRVLLLFPLSAEDANDKEREWKHKYEEQTGSSTSAA